MKKFYIQWKALKYLKDREAPKVPKITKALPIIKWTEDFADYIRHIIGVRMIPLAYVIRNTIAVPPAVPVFMAGQPHSEDNVSVEGDLVSQSSHTND